MPFPFRLTSHHNKPVTPKYTNQLPPPVRDAMPAPDRLAHQPRHQDTHEAKDITRPSLPEPAGKPAAPNKPASHPPVHVVPLTPLQQEALACRKAPDKLFIGGEFVQATAAPITMINPATGGAIGVCPSASASDAREAVKAARAAFDSGVWSKKTGAERAQVMDAFAAEVTAERQALAKLDVLNSGKPMEEALSDIDDVAKCFAYYAKLARTHKETRPIPLPADAAAFESHEESWPRGVVAAITPWNYPMLMAVWKVAPALAAGCTVVLKPAELTPWSAMELGTIAQKVGLPPGALNIIPGVGSIAGAALTSSKDVDYIAFTGSVATGKTVMRAAAENVTPVSLELGGKSPIVVCQDADLDKAVEAIRLGVFFNQGEVCSSTSRLIVHEDVADALLARLKDMASKITLGDGLEKNVTMGPIVSANQYQKVMEYIASGVAQGATLLCGGGRPAGCSVGYFVQPTIFTHVKPTMRIWREEIFGPVLAVTTYKTDDEAVKLANDTEFGLASAVISADGERRKFFRRNIQAGIVWENTSQPTFVEAPWSPWKQSGFGINLSEHGFTEYLKFKQVTSLKDT